MKKILAFAGSNSKTSINKQLAIYAASKVDNTTFETVDLNDFELPIYSFEIEENGFPLAAQEFNNKLASYDGFVVSLAEHNGSYAAVFKNIFDWVSRIDRKVFKDKPVLLMATSPGGRGGISVLDTAKNTFPHLGGAIAATFSLPNFYDNFKDGKIDDSTLNNDLLAAVKEFKSALEANNM